MVEITDADGCHCVKDINLMQGNQTLAVHPNYAVCQGASVKLLATIGGDNFTHTGEHIQWSPSEGLDDPSNKVNPIASPDHTTIYTATLDYANGCTVSAQCTVQVIKPVNEYIKKISTTYSSSYNSEFKLNGLERSFEYSYLEQPGFDCGYLIYGYIYDNFAPAIGDTWYYNSPYILKLNEEGNKVSTKTFSTDNI